jgi:hypothetical protein
MKMNQFNFILAAVLLFCGCSVNKGTITLDDLSGDKMLIIGVVEYDYSQLENKSISGIELFIESNERYSTFKLSKNYLLDRKFKKQEFLTAIGNWGNYELCFKKSTTNSPESDNLLSVLDMERSPNSMQSNALQKYTINDGKIINIGKLIVKYSGGIKDDSRISYSYSFHTISYDTIAIYAFKQTYPGIYEKYKNEIYSFKSEFDTSIEYLLNLLSEGKRLRIQSFIDENPDKLEQVFKNLNAKTQEKYADDIEKYTFEQLEDFLLK